MEPNANRPHQSAKFVGDYRDSKTKRALNRSNIHTHLCHFVYWAKTHTEQHKEVSEKAVKPTATPGRRLKEAAMEDWDGSIWMDYGDSNENGG